MTILSIKEMVDKTEKQRKDLRDLLDCGYYDHDERNIFGTGEAQNQAERLGTEDAANIQETLKNLSLTQLVKRGAQELGLPLKEFLAKSGTTGIAGSAYLIPDKIYGVMFESAKETDIVGDVSITMLPADQIPGTTLKVDIEVDESYSPKAFSPGGTMPVETMQTVQATLDFSTVYGLHFRITNDLIEDSQFNLIEMHVRNAGREMGEKATDLWATVAKVSTDGDGSLNVNAATGDSGVTQFAAGTTNDVLSCLHANLVDGFLSDTMVCPHAVMTDKVMFTIPGDTPYYGPESWITAFLQNGYPTKLGPMNVYYTECNAMTNNKAGTALCTLIFDKDYAFLSGRKRWLRIENYSDPIRDLIGATVTMRQDTVSVYDDSIAYMYET